MRPWQVAGTDRRRPALAEALGAGSELAGLRATCRRQAQVIDMLGEAVSELRRAAAALRAENTDLRAAGERLRRRAAGARASCRGGDARERFELRQGVDDRAPAGARAADAGSLRDRVAASVSAGAQVVVSALVADSVRHSAAPAASGPVVVRVPLTGAVVRLEVEYPRRGGAIAPDHQRVARDVLALAAYLVASNAPVALLHAGIGEPHGRRRRQQPLDALTAYSLIDRRDDQIDVRRLLQKVTRDHANQTGGTNVLDTLTASFPRESQDPRSWPQCETLVAHIPAYITSAPGGAGSVTLLNSVCGHLLAAGDAARAAATATSAIDLGNRLLGAEHPDTLSARANLALSYGQAGRTAEAIALQQAVLADRQRLLGAEHPDTLSARANLALSYGQAGRTAEAIALQQAVLADRQRLLGAEHPDTLSARANLALSYGQAGRIAEAIALQQAVLADRQRLLGAEHPDTLSARANLALSYGQAGRIAEAIALQQAVLADRQRLLGAEHPDTLSARNNLAGFYVLSDMPFDDAGSRHRR